MLYIGAKPFVDQSIHLPGRRFDTVPPYRAPDRREQPQFGVDGLEVTGHSQSDNLEDWLDERTEIPWKTSVLAEIELSRAIRAVAPEGYRLFPPCWASDESTAVRSETSPRSA